MCVQHAREYWLHLPIWLPCFSCYQEEIYFVTSHIHYLGFYPFWLLSAVFRKYIGECTSRFGLKSQPISFSLYYIEAEKK